MSPGNMLEAYKIRWFEKVFAIYNRNLLRRRFHSLQVSGLNFLEDKSNDTPSIIYANHSSWWDGLIFLELLRRFNFENYVIMEEKQLSNLFFFPVARSVFGRQGKTARGN